MNYELLHHPRDYFDLTSSDYFLEAKGLGPNNGIQSKPFWGTLQILLMKKVNMKHFCYRKIILQKPSHKRKTLLLLFMHIFFLFLNYFPIVYSQTRYTSWNLLTIRKERDWRELLKWREDKSVQCVKWNCFFRRCHGRYIEIAEYHIFNCIFPLMFGSDENSWFVTFKQQLSSRCFFFDNSYLVE